MNKIKELNVLDNKKLVMWLNIASFLLIFPFMAIFISLSYLSVGSDTFTTTNGSLIAGLIILVLLFFIHELIHGFFFKLFNKEGKVKYGFKQGMAYATSPGSIYPKKQFYIILLAPFVIITLALYLCMIASLISPYFFILLAPLHGSACVGDFYMTIKLMREDKDVLVEDTETGFSLYKKEVDAQ